MNKSKTNIKDAVKEPPMITIVMNNFQKSWLCHLVSVTKLKAP